MHREYTAQVKARRRIHYLENKSRINLVRRAGYKKYYETNKEKILEKQRIKRRANVGRAHANEKKYREKLKNFIFNYYGNGACACCGERQIEFLTLDHLAENGAEHRRSIKSTGGFNFYLWLKRNGYPAGFRVLCFNCNCSAFRHRGVCIHKLELNVVQMTGAQ